MLNIYIYTVRVDFQAVEEITKTLRKNEKIDLQPMASLVSPPGPRSAQQPRRARPLEQQLKKPGIQIVFGHAMPQPSPLLLAFSALAAMRMCWDGVVEAPWMKLQVLPGA